MRRCVAWISIRHTLLGFFLVAFLSLAGTTFALSAGSIRVALPMLPASGPNPFDVIVQPPIFALTAPFESLTHIDETGQARPALAKTWEKNGPLSWRFHLKPGLRFSNGDVLDASAVAGTIAILKQPDSVRYPAALLISGLVRAEAVDALTVDITTATPEPFLDRLLSAIRVVHPQQWAALGAAGYVRAPIASGSYQVDRWTATEVQLSANPYAEVPPSNPRLELLALPDPSSRLQALLSNSTQVSLGLGPDDLEIIKQSGNVAHVAPDSGVVVLNFILTKPSPLQDVRVRRALNLAVDKQAIVRDIVGGHTRIASQTAPPYAFGYNPDLEPYPYDPEQARRLLAEAGYERGFSFAAETVFGISAYAALTYQRVASDLRAIGVGMELRAIPATKYSQGIYQGKWGGLAFGLEYSVHPSFDALEPLKRHSCLWPTPWYCDQALMPDLMAALGTDNIGRRQVLTRQIMSRQRDLAPGILLYDLVRFDAVSAEVRGFQNVFGRISFEKLTR